MSEYKEFFDMHKGRYFNLKDNDGYGYTASLEDLYQIFKDRMEAEQKPDDQEYLSGLVAERDKQIRLLKIDATTNRFYYHKVGTFFAQVQSQAEEIKSLKKENDRLNKLVASKNEWIDRIEDKLVKKRDAQHKQPCLCEDKHIWESSCSSFCGSCGGSLQPINHPSTLGISALL